MENKNNWRTLGLFLGGVVAGVVGSKLIQSKEAKGLLVKTTAAALRAKDAALESGTEVQAAAEDIIAEAKEVNRKREEAAVEEKE
ncbi:DUF6110 family protein [Phascolarctobacterium faecium]|uniref:DUF6110 family protein n=1 Tax=Phascolarctobacterium faecium TaxID=33025 RepID=UPI003AEF2F6E